MNDIRLEKTCIACPEQYDAFIGDRQVGYLRLRHGNFTVEYPDVLGTLVYQANTKGDGMFEDEEERDYHLDQAKASLMMAEMFAWLIARSQQ